MADQRSSSPSSPKVRSSKRNHKPVARDWAFPMEERFAGKADRGTKQQYWLDGSFEYKMSIREHIDMLCEIACTRLWALDLRLCRAQAEPAGLPQKEWELNKITTSSNSAAKS
ncbi:hypothetical protein DIPPA_19516 [Diplonema papillatum]|nr:hypothetical protein DIPPA_19516 [Diplonema papillatum]